MPNSKKWMKRTDFNAKSANLNFQLDFRMYFNQPFSQPLDSKVWDKYTNTNENSVKTLIL